MTPLIIISYCRVMVNRYGHTWWWAAGDNAGEHKRYREPHLLPRLIGGFTGSPGTGKALGVACCPRKTEACQVPDSLSTLGPKIHQWTLGSLPYHGNSEGWNPRNQNEVRPVVGCRRDFLLYWHQPRNCSQSSGKRFIWNTQFLGFCILFPHCFEGGSRKSDSSSCQGGRRMPLQT